MRTLSAGGSNLPRMDALETNDLLQPVLADLAVLVGSVGADHLAATTPCPEMDVSGLLDHTLSWLTVFAGGYDDPDGQAPMDELAAYRPSADRAAEVAAAAARLDAAITSGAAERPLSLGGSAMSGELALSMILWEYQMHGWDLARATGRPWQPAAEASQASLDFAPAMLTPDFQGPGKAFGPRVDVPPDASALDRLLGLSGRNPAWPT